MNTTPAKFASRKFWAFLGTLLMLAGALLHGDGTWGQMVWPAVLAFLGYAGLQGAIDLAGAMGTPAPTATRLDTSHYAEIEAQERGGRSYLEMSRQAVEAVYTNRSK